MIFKVHWIIDGVAEIDAENKNDAEKKIQNDLEEYVKNSDRLMNHFIAQSIQGTAYLPGTDEPKKSGDSISDSSKKEDNKSQDEDKNNS